MTKHTSISVIIPLYNKCAHIIETIETVLSQTLQPLEIVVVNDGSTDGGENFVREKIATDRRYSNVRLINQANGGVSKARNRGIQEAYATHLAFLDADDSWEPHYLEEIQTLMCRFPNAKAFATNYQKRMAGVGFVNPKIRLVSDSTVPFTMHNYFDICANGDLPFMTSSICVSKAVIEDVGYFPEGEPMGEDQDMWSRIALAGVIAYSPRVLAFYHLDADNRACLNNVPSEECPFSQRLHAKVLDGRIPEERKSSVLKYTAAHLLALARDNIRAGKIDIAKKLLQDTRTNLLPIKRLRCCWMMNIARTKAA